LNFGTRESKFGFKWRDDDPDTAAYLCFYCAALFTQSDYFTVWDKGRWIARGGEYLDDESNFCAQDNSLLPVPDSVGFEVWTAYSPQATWPNIVREYKSAIDKARTGDKSEIKSFTNTTLGQAYAGSGKN
jgi:phage terminase large subunit GpA-like protein